MTKNGQPKPVPKVTKVSEMFETWEELENSIINCNKCKLYQGRQNIVFGTGNKEADLMFIVL